MSTITHHWRRWIQNVQATVIAAAVGLMGISPGVAGDISYVYDQLGRLIAVIDPATDTAVYSYDAVGNLTGITRQASSTLAIFQFTPSSGPVGTAVTIYGTGFSATPGSNTVKFNGTTTTVLTASTTVLTANVPSGATNGPISVTVGASTANSSTNFTVGTAGAPTLTSFSPAVAGYGETVTFTGTNYDTTPINNTVAFAAAMGAVNTASATTLTVPVPSTAQTGKISISTPQGQVISTQELYVAPPGVASADIQYTGRATVNGSTVVASITTANKNGLLVFDGIAGQRIDLGFSSVSIGQFSVMVYRPDGAGLMVIPSSINASGGGIELPVLPMTGTYTIFLDPYSTYTGNATVTVSTEITGSITPGGSAVAVSLSRVGQNARYTFSGSSGQTVSLGMTSVSISSSDVKILKPDGTVLVSKGGVYTTDVIDTQVLPTSGTYAVIIDPALTYTGSMTLTLYNTADVTGTIDIDGTTVAPSLTVPGQRARYTFTGTAGQLVNVGLSSVSITSSTVSMLRPDGTTLATAFIATSGGSLDPTALPSTGTYTIVVDPASTYTGTATLTLSSPQTGSITIDGSSVGITLTRVGETARYTFSGTSGQQLNLGLTAVSISNVYVSIIRPDGATLTMSSFGTAGGSLDPPSPLPITGTYTIVVDPSGVATGSITVTLSAEVTGTLTIGASPVAVSIGRAGQNARYTFDGTASQLATVRITGNNFSGLTTIRLLRQNGTFLTYTWSSSASFNLSQVTLPATETYTITVDPSAVSTGSLNLQVTNP